MTKCTPRADNLCIKINEDYDITHTLTVKVDGSVFDLTGYTAKQEFRNAAGVVIATATPTINIGAGTIRMQIPKATTVGAAMKAEVNNRLDTDIYLSHATKLNFFLYEAKVPVLDRVTEE